MTRRRLAVAGVAALALAIRCLYLWQISGAPFFHLRFGDGEAYHLWAKRIAAGDWPGRDVFYQAPLYPYFLAALYRLFDDGVTTVRIAQAVLGAASCALLSWAGWRMFGRRGLLAGAVLAIYPPAIFLDGQLDKTALATVLLCGLLALYAARQWLWAGVVLGLLALTRENALVLGIPMLWAATAPSRSSGKQRLRHDVNRPHDGNRPDDASLVTKAIGAATVRERLAFVAGVLLVLLPAGLRNLAAGGEFHITTAQSGPNLYIGNHAGAPGWYEPLVTGHGSAADERDDATRLAEQARGRKLTAGEVSRYWSGRAAAFVRERPAEWLRLTARKLALTVNNGEIADTESQAVYAEWSWVLRAPLGFGVLLAAAALNWRGDRRLWWMAAVYAASVAAFYVLARYRFPLVPMLALLAVSIPRRPAVPAIAAAVVAAVVALLPLVDPRPGRATNYYAIATAFSRDAARLDDAASFYRRAIEIEPRFAGAKFGLATVLTRQGRAEDALPHYRAAVATWPDHEEARYNYGHALASTGRVAEAAEQYAAAVRLRPDDADAHIALAHSLVKLGREEEALPHFARAAELQPDSAPAHANLGAALANRGRVAEALPHFERAAALHPSDENARRNLEAAREMLRLRRPSRP